MSQGVKVSESKHDEKAKGFNLNKQYQQTVHPVNNTFQVSNKYIHPLESFLLNLVALKQNGSVSLYKHVRE